MQGQDLITRLPKAELHLHIEGTLEPTLLMKLAKKNKIEIKYDSVEAVTQAYKFNNLQDFLDIYYQGMSVLQDESDFYELAHEYVQKCKVNNIKHCEVFFDPQGHLERGISFQTLFNGIYRAFAEAQKEGELSFHLIMCFLRHLSEEDAFKTLQLSLPFKGKIYGVGLDSTEVGNPPSKHKNVFAKAKEYGFHLVAHAGEEGSYELIQEAIQVLKIERIDHGIRCMDNAAFVKKLAEKQIALTVCPMSNLMLQVVKDLKQHPLKKMLDSNLLVTINSDDPAYFGGYLNHNYSQVQKALGLSDGELKKLAKNSFVASFIGEQEKKKWMQLIDNLQ